MTHVDAQTHPKHTHTAHTQHTHTHTQSIHTQHTHKAYTHSTHTHKAYIQSIHTFKARQKSYKIRPYVLLALIGLGSFVFARYTRTSFSVSMRASIYLQAHSYELAFGVCCLGSRLGSCQWAANALQVWWLWSHHQCSDTSAIKDRRRQIDRQP